MFESRHRRISARDRAEARQLDEALKASINALNDSTKAKYSSVNGNMSEPYIRGQKIECFDCQVCSIEYFTQLALDINNDEHSADKSQKVRSDSEVKVVAEKMKYVRGQP